MKATLKSAVAALCTRGRHAQKRGAKLAYFNIEALERSPVALFNLPTLVSLELTRSTERSLHASRFSDVNLVTGHNSRERCKLKSRDQNPLIVGPRLRSSQVLRDTIGERFLCKHKRSVFVNEFVPRQQRSRTQIVTSKIHKREF